MVFRRLARWVLGSKRVRAVWQSDFGWSLIRSLPYPFREYMKSFYRSVLIVPKIYPWYNNTRIERWEPSIPILSVVIPCYNYGRYIHETLQSLASQTFSDFETIVVDDGSDDQLTLNILDELQYTGIKVLRQEKSNVATALNLGIRAGRGCYVCCIAADDIVNPTYFEKCLGLLESNPGVAFAYSLVRTFGDENRIWFTEPFDLRVLLEYNYICAAAVFRKTVWEEVGGFNERMDGYEDWDFWLRVAKAGSRGELIPEVLFNYRRHGSTLNIRSDQKYSRLIQQIKTNHDELYSNAKRIEEIEEHYRNIRVPTPFLNLGGKSQYGFAAQAQLAVVASPHDTAKLFFERHSNEPKTSVNFVLVSSDVVSDEMDITRFTDSNQCYYLERFLDPYCWLDFAINLIDTRSSRFLVISGTTLAYELASAVKTRTSVFVVNLVQDRFESLRSSAKYDEFIDLHIVPSDHALKSLVGDLRVSAKKIHSLSKVQPIDNVNDLLNVLITYDKETNQD